MRTLAFASAIINGIMNLLSLIIIFLALVIVGAIAFIAWELTSERTMPRNDTQKPDDPNESKESSGST